MKSTQMKCAMAAMLMCGSLGLTACGGSGSSGNDAPPASDNGDVNPGDGATAGNGTTPGDGAAFSLTDTSWAPASEDILALTYALDGGADAGIVAAKHIAKPNANNNNYKIMAASATNGDLASFSEGTFRDSTDEEVDVVAFKHASRANDTVLISCVSGLADAGSINSVAYAFLTGANFNISLASNANDIGSISPLRFNDTNSLDWTVTECRGMSEVGIDAISHEYTFLAAVELARLYQNPPQMGTFATIKDAIIRVRLKPVGTIGDPGVSITNADVTVDILHTDTRWQSEITNVAAIDDSSFYFTSTYYEDIPNSRFRFYYSRLDKVDSANGHQTLINSLEDPFTSLSDQFWNVADMALYGDTVYFVAADGAGLVAADGTNTFTKMDQGDYRYCQDALAFNGGTTDATAKMWCHDSTDTGTMLEFTPPDIPNPVDNAPAP